MSKNWPHRPPAVFRLDDDDVIVGLTKDEPAKRAVQVIPEPDAETSVIAVDDPFHGGAGVCVGARCFGAPWAV